MNTKYINRYISEVSNASPAFAEWVIEQMFMYGREGDADLAYFLYGMGQ